MRTILLLILTLGVALSAAENPFPAVTLRNDAAEVELSTLQGSLKSFRVLGVKPIEYYAWHERQLASHGVRLPDPKLPLAVLDEFNPTGGKHNWIAGVGLPAPGAMKPWTVVQSAPHQAIMTLRDEARDITWTMTCTLLSAPAAPGQPTGPGRTALLTQLRVENAGAADLDLTPTVFPINGIHQDDPAADGYYATVGRHIGGAKDNIIENLGQPEPGKSLPVPTDGLDYVVVKSRFFVALYAPGALVVEGTTPEAPAAAKPVASAPTVESGGPPMGAVVATASPVAALPGSGYALSIAAHGYKLPVQHGGTLHAFIEARYSANGAAIRLKPGQRLSMDWRLTVAALDKAGLARLDDIERKAEFTEGYYRFFRILAKACTWLLDMVAKVVVNYGVAILLLTFLIKLALHRTTFKQQESMMKMQKLQPELKLLQETYKTDKQKLAQKQMELWKKHGVNPLGGCLPIFIQIPIFTALYLAFSHSADMRGEGFLWIKDLTLPDAVYGWNLAWLWGWNLTINPLPIIYIGVTVWMSMSQKMPTGGDPTQEQTMKMMRWMPVVFGFIFYSMPSGLVLYFTANAVLSTIEIKMVKKKLGID